MRLVRLVLLLFPLLALAACKGGAAGVTPPTSPGSTTPDKPTKSVAKIVAFGDSLTAGYGLSPTQSYPALLQKKLDEEGMEYEVVNAGISGDTSAGGVRRIDWSMEGLDVKVVVLELGANDILRGQPIDELKKNLKEIIRHAKAHGADVLLAGMEAPTNSGPEYRRLTHGVFSEVAREQNIPMIPFFLDGVAGIPSLNQEDGIHPNPQGTQIVADTVFRYLKPMLTARESK